MLNFDLWDQLLHQYVDSEGKVDYQAWKVESAESLKQWLNQLSGLNLAEYPDSDQQLALWLNLYNALVIDQILAVYPIHSTRPTILGLPNWIEFFQFFQRQIYQLDSRTYSLNQIEHETIRPQFQDPRVHFALVCGAVGCPLLRSEAYQPDKVQQQLEQDAERFINNADKVYFKPPDLYVSQIFKWYKKDFLNDAGSIPAYIQKYCSDSVNLDATRIRYLEYDWSLNQRASS